MNKCNVLLDVFERGSDEERGGWRVVVLWLREEGWCGGKEVCQAIANFKKVSRVQFTCLQLTPASWQSAGQSQLRMRNSDSEAFRIHV